MKSQSVAKIDGIESIPSGLKFRGHILELDGLRAIAVVLVLFTHFGPESRAGLFLWKLESVGWIGVDLFFVLSGFLITGILLDGREGQFYYRRFYIRRSLRILPLYYCVLLASLFMQIEQHVGSTAHNLYEASWYFVYLGNVHSAFTDHMPGAPMLGPLWSLQIEEQFYLIFPFLVRNLRPQLLALLLFCVVCLSVSLRWGLYLWNPHWLLVQYVSSPCRLDGLALGGLVALGVRVGSWRFRPVYIVLVVVSLCGALSGWLAWSGYDWSTGRNRTFGYSIVALAFTSVLLWVLYFRGGWQTGWLRMRPLRYLGKISYGLYLLQVPAYLLVANTLSHFGKHLVAGWSWHTVTWGGFVAVGVVAVSLASLSWYALERPWLRAKDRFTTSLD
jgi:peptidoglycan/LPS O-acetylase OafA/YrhL